MSITRTAWTDDDGTGTTGTPLNNAEKTLLYNQIDASCAFVNQSNVFAGKQTISSSIDPGLSFIDTSQPANQRLFSIYQFNQQLTLHALTDDAVSGIGYVSITRAGNLIVVGDLYEKTRSIPLGHWSDVAYTPGLFWPHSGTWSVPAGSFTSFSYALIGKTMLVQLALQDTTIAGAPSSLYVGLPGGVIVARRTQGASHGATAALGWGSYAVTADAGWSYLQLSTLNATAWPAGLFSIWLTITIRLQ